MDISKIRLQGSNQKKKGDDAIHLVLWLYNSSYQKCIPKEN